jgi:tripartite-type tricarboxylate transporter receptor subunit TctC
MKPHARIAAATLIALLALANPVPALSQPYPSKFIKFVVGGAPGGGADLVARAIAQTLSEGFGQQVVVEARSGGGGVIAAQAALAAPADGYTMFLANAINMSVAPAVMRALPYDPVRDFSPVTLLAIAPLLVAVHPSVQAKTIKDFVMLAKSQPGRLRAASNGNGTIQHLAIEMLTRDAGISLLHVPYKNGAQAVTDTVGGHVDLIITALPTVLSQVKASRLRALAVTSSERSKAAPDIPTLAESGFAGFEATQWYGIFARANTPPAIIERWHAEVRRAVQTLAVTTALTREGAEPAVSGPKALSDFHRADMARWNQVVRDAKLQTE